MSHFTRKQRLSSLIAALLIATAVTGTLSGCGAKLGKEEKERQKVEHLYDTARRALVQERYQEAAERFEELETSYPFSIYSKQVSLALAFLYYRNYEYDEALAILDQFIRLNPRYEHLDYAYYLKGLTHYYYGQSFISLLLKRDRTTKDATPLIESFDAFKALHERYPDSRYAEDAKLRTIVLRNMLAVHEIRIADYYLQRGAYVAVVNRIKYMLEHYEDAQHTPEGLALLAEAYQRLHLNDLADDTRRVLALNYPNYHKTKKVGEISEADKRSWFGRLKDWANRVASFLSLKPKY